MDHEKAVLIRYLENELRKPDFLECKDYQQITSEVLLFAYFAGHGCADTNQYFVLNEDNMDKVFWPAERKLMKLAQKCGVPLKIIVVYDICREPIAVTTENVLKFHGEQAKMKALEQSVPAVEEAKSKEQSIPEQKKVEQQKADEHKEEDQKVEEVKVDKQDVEVQNAEQQNEE